MDKPAALKAAILKRRPSRDVENVKKIKKPKKAKDDSRVPLSLISNKLDSFQEQQDLPKKGKVQHEGDYHASYSMLGTSSFYETVPFEIELHQEEEGKDNAEDITYFGFDLRKHARMLRRREAAYQPKPNYMKWQPHVIPKMRMILLHWLSEVCEEFGYHRDTWNVAVNCVDRFLSCVPQIDRKKLQLIGVAAILVACKMEEQHVPGVSVLEMMSDGACPKEEIVQMEKLMLQKIGWLLLPVTPYIFVRLYLLMLLKSKASPELVTPSYFGKDDVALDGADTKFRICKGSGSYSKIVDLELAFPKREFVKMMNIVDIALMDYASVKYSPSLIAASVLYLVYVPNDPMILEITEYSEEQIMTCIEWLRPFSGVPMPRSNNLVEQPDYYCMQTSNPNAKVFLENYLS
eukprot:Phypoly_transcript_07696.p1 GENE.Phypoly_transcript_07696~~Phypoly_transcript_07696.p1  ORF type:complete len:434 (+),score=64.44 Phypoly_transcript_07696:88-1302(+)